jgi:hypothetical protein
MDKKIVPSLERLYNDVRSIIETARANAYRAVNFSMVQAYWEIGRTIVEKEQEGGSRADYGSRLLLSLSDRLTVDYGRGFDESNLRNMRMFYLRYQKRDALRPELSWTHYRILMRVEKEPAREFYLQECVEGNWSTRQLERQINSLYFERILMSSKQGRPLVKKEADDKKEVMQAEQIIKDPYVQLTHQDIGQMDFYVRYFEDQIRQDTDNPTIGLILCAEKDKTIAKYSLLSESKQIFASKYKLYLPTVKELQQEIDRERTLLEQENRLME